jgi:type II secretory pathway pseudopilin PulG
MTILVAALVVILIVAIVALVAAPLRRRATAAASGSDRRDELEAAREAKYRELRDLELDYRTGKLSDEDYAALDRALRAEAIVILHELDGLD